MTKQDLEELAKVLAELATAVRDRLDELEYRVQRLEQQPRQSLSAKLREKGLK